MTSDTMKLLFTYLIAAIVIVGGGTMLFLTRLDPPDSASQDYGLLIAGFIGAAITYVFNRETGTQATRAAESAYRNAQPTVTMGGQPPTTTVAPSEPQPQP